MLKLIQGLAAALIFAVSFAHAAPEAAVEEAQDWPQAQMMFVDQVMQSEWVSEFSARQSITNGMSSVGLEAVGRSCSSKDGNKDCYCTGGCWRTQTDCGCN